MLILRFILASLSAIVLSPKNNLLTSISLVCA
nr:MAG TPA: hypothetical protein [Bacteriophage sp.]DAH37764.1 MAG TPA: hypothetical protein [Caudoviricetes sp.]